MHLDENDMNLKEIILLLALLSLKQKVCCRYYYVLERIIYLSGLKSILNRRFNDQHSFVNEFSQMRNCIEVKFIFAKDLLFVNSLGLIAQMGYNSPFWI